MTGDQIRAMQREHIVAFLSDQDFTGKVLDYGCGTQPYRAIVEFKGGEYHGYNRGVYPGGSKEDIGPAEPLMQWWDVVLCTQVVEYVPDVPDLLAQMRSHSNKLVITWPTNWPEVEPEDLHRFTLTGMTAMLRRYDWQIEQTRQLGAVAFGDREHMALGYGIVAT